MQTEGLSFPEAVERLAQQAGMPLPKVSYEDEEREQRRKTLHDVVELAAKFFEATLASRAGRAGARLSRRPRHRSGDAGDVPSRLRAGGALRAQGASRQGRRVGRGHGDGRPADQRRRHPGAVRPLPRPRDLSDQRLPRPRHRVRRPHAGEGRAAEIPELAGDAALPQGRDALQHRQRAHRRPQGRAGDRGRRLCRRDRAGVGRLRGDGRAARHRADRRAARADSGRWRTSRCCASTATAPAAAPPTRRSTSRCRCSSPARA